MIISIISNNQIADFKVEENQVILDVLNIIAKDSNLSLHLDGLQYVTSKRKKESVSIKKTFQEAGIYNGDILYIGG
ncbi:hypothetical protein EDD63_1842 [Breznakia blatticola]|uniref:Uncharacterized protein n=1 Tax=Breznakia blatticola TaxID=1754012 RepID=A0A4R7Z9Y2_9FIRM|nr:hypothetical protein [Breznakia blatticola]TDW07791.1 hypothetical protein EDD63_1842 [Breznakia blatticola]